MKNINYNNYNKRARLVDRIFGWSAIALSITIVTLFFIVSVVGAVLSFMPFVNNFDAAEVIEYGFFLGLIWVFVGVKALRRAERSMRYADIFGMYPRVRFSEVIKRTGKSLRSVSADLNTLKERGYFNDIEFDLDNKEVVFSPNTEPLPHVGDEDLTVYKERKGVPFLAIFTGFMMIGGFSWGFAIVALLFGIGAFFLVLKFFPRPVFFFEAKRVKKKVVRGDIKKKVQVSRAPSSTGNSELDDVLKSIFENKNEIVRLSQSIVSPKIRIPLEDILRTVDAINNFVTYNPSKIRSLRQFTSYYLPTTVNFLKTYEELEQKVHKGDNITAAMEKIEEVTANLTAVFKREYDDLYSDKAMDISAEAAVMQSIIKENENII